MNNSAYSCQERMVSKCICTVIISIEDHMDNFDQIDCQIGCAIQSVINIILVMVTLSLELIQIIPH